MKNSKISAFFALIVAALIASCEPQATKTAAPANTVAPQVAANTSVPVNNAVTSEPMPTPPTAAQRISLAKTTIAKIDPIAKTYLPVTTTYLIDLYDSLSPEERTSGTSLKAILEKELGTSVTVSDVEHAKSLLGFVPELKSLQNDTYYPQDDPVPNVCRTKSHAIPFKIGPPFWWYVISFLNGVTNRACFVQYDSAGNPKFTDPIDPVENPRDPGPNCDVGGGSLSLANPESREITSADSSSDTIVITSYKVLLETNAYLPCIFDPKKALATDDQTYSEFWIKVVGTFTGTWGSGTVTKSLAFYRDPAEDPANESATGLSLIISPTGATRVVTTLNGKDYTSSGAFSIPVGKSVTVGMYFRSFGSGDGNRVLIPWVELEPGKPQFLISTESINSPDALSLWVDMGSGKHELVKVQGDNSLPEAVRLKGGGFGAISSGEDT